MQNSFTLYLPLPLLGALECFRNLQLLRFHLSTAFTDSKLGSRSRARISFLPWESRRVKVLNRKIDVLSRGEINFQLCTQIRGVFPIYSKARVEKDFFVSPA